MNKMLLNTKYPIKRLKFVVTINDEVLTELTNPDFEINYIDIGNVDSTGKINEIVKYKFIDAPSRARRKVRKGDVIFSTVRTYLRAIASIENDIENLIVSTGFAVIRTKEDIFYPNFCKYALTESNFIDEVQKRSVGVSYPAINVSDLSDIFLPVPTYKTQMRISIYLDKEVTKIDALIDKKNQLISILNEKKKIVLNNAVTKGLESTVALKNSKIEWLGKVPEHWKLVKMKYFVEINYGLSQPPEYLDEGVPLIRATNVFRGKISDKDMVYIDKDQLNSNKKIILKEGDIIIVRSGAYTADSAIITEKYENSVAGFDMVIRCKKTLSSKYLSYVLLADYMLNKQLIPMTVRAAQPHLNAEEVGSAILLLPSLEEQGLIIEYLDNFLYLNEKSLDLIKNSIKLLEEKRTAIISAAINGELKL